MLIRLLVLIMLFRIELFRKEKCTYNKTKCIASNRRLREGEDSTDESDRTQF